MLIVVDGYNLIKTVLVGQQEIPDQRTWLVRLMNAYAKKKGNEVLVVFDAGPFSWASTETPSKRVKVVCSGTGSTADEYIYQFCAEYTSGDLLLVSDDNQLARAIHSLGRPSIGSLHFYNLVKDTLGSQAAAKPISTPTTKISTESNPALDALMQEASAGPMPGKDDAEVERAKQPKQKRHERRLAKIVKKL